MKNPAPCASVNPSASLSAGGGQALPELLVDSREKKPLVFEHLPYRSCSLRTGDYSIRGLESRFTVERKSMPDLIGTLSQRRDSFMAEIERMLGFDFRRLIIVGERDELERVLSRRCISKSAVFGSLAAIDARGVPVVWCVSPEQAARQIECWAWYYYAGLSKALNGKPLKSPIWARDAMMHSSLENKQDVIINSDNKQHQTHTSIYESSSN